MSIIDLDDQENEYKCLNCKRLVLNKQQEIKTWLGLSKNLLADIQLLNDFKWNSRKIEDLLKQARDNGIHTLDDSEPSWINFIRLSEHLMGKYINDGNDQQAVSIAIENLCENYMYSMLFFVVMFICKYIK